jgi:hypothetical protein
MVEDVVDVDSINSFVVEFEVKEFARFLEFNKILVTHHRNTTEKVTFTTDLPLLIKSTLFNVRRTETFGLWSPFYRDLSLRSSDA